MKVLLVDPPFYRLMGFRNYGFPVALAMLAGLLENEGHEVRILDADFTGEAPRTNPEYLASFYPLYLDAVGDPRRPIWGEVEAEVARFGPDLVGVGVMTPKVPSAVRVVEAARRAAPRAAIVAGGPHPTLKTREFLDVCPEVDCAVRGDGFSVLPEIARTVARGGRPSDRTVQGRPGAVEFDSLPFAARHLLANREGYVSDELGILLTSAGCPFRCTFCSTHAIWEKGRHARSPERVVAEIRAVHREHRVRAFAFMDDVFAVPRERAIEICRRLEVERLPVKWTCLGHANALDPELVRAMKAAGCTKVSIGVESGSDRVLKAINKGVTKERVREAKRVLDREGMLWTAFFLVGIVDETREEMLETLAFMKELSPPFASLGVYENYPGTALFERGIDLGVTKPTMERREFFEIAPSHYYFAGGRRRVASHAPEAYEETVARVLAAFHAHNHSPKTLARRAWRKRRDYLDRPGHLWTDLRRLGGKLRIGGARPA